MAVQLSGSVLPHGDVRKLFGYPDKGRTMFEAALTRKIKFDGSWQIKQLGDGFLGITDH